MRIEIHEEPSNAVWDKIVAAAEACGVYHQSGWLEALASASKLSVSRIVVDIDQTPSIAFPLCLKRIGPVSACLSPPPRMGLEYLGPLLEHELNESPKKEKYRLEAMNRLIDWIQERFRPGLVYVRTAPLIRDLRPFSWRGYRVHPLYTYLMDLPTRDEQLLGSFDRTVRSDITRTEAKVEVRQGGRELVRHIHSFVAARYRASGETFGPTLSYLTKLYDVLGPESFQPIGAYTERGLEAGAIVTCHAGWAAYWQGGTASDHSRLPLTTQLIWHAIRVARDRGCSKFELVGANTRRLISFKSKFGLALEPFFEASLASGPSRLALATHRLLRG